MANNKDMYIELANRIYDLDGEVYKCVGSSLGRTFTGSRENPTYSELSRGIKWGNQSGATFPGYISILNGAAEKESWSGDEGRFRELERLIDLDGSWWWWPYKIGAQTGDVVRMNSCGKCGWGAGIFFILFITEFLSAGDARPRHCSENKNLHNILNQAC